MKFLTVITMLVVVVVSVSARNTVLERIWGVDTTNTVEPEYVDDISKLRFVSIAAGPKVAGGSNVDVHECEGVDNAIMKSVTVHVNQAGSALKKSKKGEFTIHWDKTLTISVQGHLKTDVGPGWRVGSDLKDGGMVVRGLVGFPRKDPIENILAEWRKFARNDPTVPKSVPFKGAFQFRAAFPIPPKKWGFSGSYGKIELWLEDATKKKHWCVKVGPFELR